MKKITHIHFSLMPLPHEVNPVSTESVKYTLLNVLNFWRQPQIWLSVWGQIRNLETINSLNSHDFTGRSERRVSFNKGLMFLVDAVVWCRTLQAILHVNYGAKNVMTAHTGVSSRRHFLETRLRPLFTRHKFPHQMQHFCFVFYVTRLRAGALESACL